MTTLTARRGDTFERTAHVDADDGAAYNLTNATLWWTLKLASDAAATDDNAVRKLHWVSGGLSDGISVADPLTGEVVVTLTPAQTDALVPGTRYRYDLQLRGADGKVFTVERGPFYVRPDTTRRVTTP